MYQVKNIANDRFKGALFMRDKHFGSSVSPLTLQLEPIIGSRVLKIGTSILLTPEEFIGCKDVIDTHITGCVVEVINLNPIMEAPTPVVVVETKPIDTTVLEAPVVAEKAPEPVKLAPVITPPVVLPKAEEKVDTKKGGKSK